MSEDITPDYHFICDIDTPKSERKDKNIGDYYINAAKCMECGDTVRSKNRRHFATCSCGSVSVDGGSHYLRRVGRPDCFKDLSEKFSDVG